MLHVLVNFLDVFLGGCVDWRGVGSENSFPMQLKGVSDFLWVGDVSVVYGEVLESCR